MNHYNMTSTSAQYPAPEHGGRVPNINDPSTFQFAARPYKLYAEGASVLGDNPRRDLVGTMHTETPLNSVFFSLSNIDRIQQAIHDQVSSMSGGQYDIGRQSDDDLRIVMRSYYLMFGRNDPHNIAGELEQLNRRVIGYCAGKVYSEVEFHMFYRKDLEDFAPPIANPVNVKSYGTHAGELKSFF
jgi:hypothetical protein